MQRRKVSREFKIEAVKLVRERGVSVAQASRDLDVHENVLRKWVKGSMSRSRRSTATRDGPGSRPVRRRISAAQAHLRPVRRSRVRALGHRSVFPARNQQAQSKGSGRRQAPGARDRFCGSRASIPTPA
jgi:transposase